MNSRAAGGSGAPLRQTTTTCTTGSDHLSNCGTCPVIDAAHALADHVNGTTP